MLDNALARKSLDQRLTPLRQKAVLARPHAGWIRAIREALGMTTTQFASRLGISQSRASRLQADEANDAITLRKLREAAEALDCTLVYALVPKKPLDDMLRERAAAIADRTIAHVSHSMALENQTLSPDRAASERERLIESLLSGALKHVWKQP
jgi:predicted DNA-binding mobile mystery protein A